MTSTRLANVLFSMPKTVRYHFLQLSSDTSRLFAKELRVSICGVIVITSGFVNHGCWCPLSLKKDDNRIFLKLALNKWHLQQPVCIGCGASPKHKSWWLVCQTMRMKTASSTGWKHLLLGVARGGILVSCLWSAADGVQLPPVPCPTLGKLLSKASFQAVMWNDRSFKVAFWSMWSGRDEIRVGNEHNVS